jgi:ethanolamine utilization cobalamin adenosyltransferase
MSDCFLRDEWLNPQHAMGLMVSGVLQQLNPSLHQESDRMTRFLERNLRAALLVERPDIVQGLQRLEDLFFVAGFYLDERDNDDEEIYSSKSRENE